MAVPRGPSRPSTHSGFYSEWPFSAANGCLMAVASLNCDFEGMDARLYGSNLSTLSQGGAQRVVDACLPSLAACTERFHHIGIQPDFDGLFGDFLPASHGTASTARNNLLWGVNPRKPARLGLCQGLTQPRQRLTCIV